MKLKRRGTAAIAACMRTAPVALGLAPGHENIGLTEVPFAAWLPNLAYWGPLIILMTLCVMALSLMVHRQWAHHEQLSYPLAQVATAFIHSEKGGRGPAPLGRRRPLAFLLYLPKKKTCPLDRLGNILFHMVDDESTFEQIIDRFGAPHQLTFFESLTFVQSYLRSLMRRGIIVLHVARPSTEGP